MSIPLLSTNFSNDFDWVIFARSSCCCFDESVSSKGLGGYTLFPSLSYDTKSSIPYSASPLVESSENPGLNPYLSASSSFSNVHPLFPPPILIHLPLYSSQTFLSFDSVASAVSTL